MRWWGHRTLDPMPLAVRERFGNGPAGLNQRIEIEKHAHADDIHGLGNLLALAGSELEDQIGNDGQRHTVGDIVGQDGHSDGDERGQALVLVAVVHAAHGRKHLKADDALKEH